MTAPLKKLINGDRIKAFLSTLGGKYELHVESTGNDLLIDLSNDMTVFLRCPVEVEPSQTKIVSDALTGMLLLEYELCDLTNELSDVYEELTLLYRLSSAFSGTLQIERIQQKALEEITTILDVERAGVFMLNEAADELILVAGIGFAPSDIGQVTWPKGSDTAWDVLQNGTPVFSNFDSAGNGIELGRKNRQTRLLVALPSKAGIIGVLAVFQKGENEEFDSKDEKLLSAIAQQMGGMLENAGLYHEAQELFRNTVEALSAAIDAKDPYTHGHSRRVTNYSVAIAKEMGLPQDQVENIRISALLHDIGKLGVSEAILRKPSRLTSEEFEQIKQHPVIGADIMNHVKKLSRFLPGMIDHHEKFSGGGYPTGRSQEEISLAGRIIAVADTFDAMTSDRPYHENCKGKPDDVALTELKRCSGTQFEPAIVDCFLRAYEKGAVKNSK
ncbi:MAG: HD domain-containing protein [Candidatus Riflebacteria bacterium]|nr:HD domain-containing protein [Candidatus Riflebacteria bacterium]